MNARNLILVSALAALNPIAFAQQPKPAEAAAKKGSAQDLVDTAIAAGSFTTLVTAVKAAGLVEALKGDGPFTVFAPTDAAFAKLDKATLTALLLPHNQAQLTKILTYHVVPGRFDAKQVVASKSLTTLAGIDLPVRTDDHGVFVGNVNVIKTDIATKNGIIHVVDAVILPPELPSIVELASKAGSFKTLLAAAKAAGLVEALSGDGPLTVFAPTDAAFAKLPKGTVESLLLPENLAKLQTILKYHVVAGRVDARAAIGAGKAATLMGQELTFEIREGRLCVNGANVVANDLPARNGVVHVIDAVILPN